MIINFKEFLNEGASDGTYAAFKLTHQSALQLQSFMQHTNIPGLVPPHDYHITTVFSRNTIDYEPEHYEPITVQPIGYELLGRPGDDPVLVLRVEHPKLNERFEHARALGASWDFPSYKPHITLTEKLSGMSVDVNLLAVPTFGIQLDSEYVQDLKK